MNVAVQDIDWTAEKSWQPKPSLENTINYVSGNFIDKANFFGEKDLPPRVNSTWETDDGGQRFATFLSMKAVNDWAQAQRITHRVHQASRYGGLSAFVGALWLIELEQGDWFTLTAPRWNMVTKYFEVNEITLTQDFRVAIVAQEVSTSLDDWDHAVDEFARTDTTWNPPPYTLPVPAFTLAGYSTFTATTGIQDFGFTLTPTSPVALEGNFATGIEVEWALAASRTVTHSAGSMTFDQLGKTVVGLLPNTSYSVRARTVDGGNRHSSWSAWSDITTPTQDTTTVRADIIADDPTLIAADVTGAPKTGEINKDIILKLRQLGVDLTSGITWAATRLSGNATFSITGSGTATLSITGPNDATLNTENLFRISATYAGVVNTRDLKIIKQSDIPSTSGGAGGGGGGTGGSSGSTATLGSTTGTAYDTTNSVSGTIAVNTGSVGRIDFAAPISFKRTATTVGQTGAYGKWQWRVPAGTWADVSTETAYAEYAEKDAELFTYAGSLAVSDAKTGLTANTAYEARFLWRRVDVAPAASNIYRVSGTMTAAGS